MQVLSLELRINDVVIRIRLYTLLSFDFILDELLSTLDNFDECLFIFIILNVSDERHHFALYIFQVIGHAVVRATMVRVLSHHFHLQSEHRVVLSNIEVDRKVVSVIV